MRVQIMHSTDGGKHWTLTSALRSSLLIGAASTGLGGVASVYDDGCGNTYRWPTEEEVQVPA